MGRITSRSRRCRSLRRGASARGRSFAVENRGFLAFLFGGLLFTAGATTSPAAAQHEGHEGHGKPSRPRQRPAAAVPSRRLFQSDMALMAGMTPEEPAEDRAEGRWHTMVLGLGRLVTNHQGGDSGDDAVESTNWNMVMAQRSFGRARLTLMLMNSLEPATIPERGSPQLFQTGEAFEGMPLVDRQHPHDFFMNLSATLRASLSPASAFWFQLAPSGEPALGPTAYMHRASSGDNPSAPLGHHWQDSSHIAWNVITAGGGFGRLALEGSIFHGGEPDEDRWDIEGGRLDSVAGRVRLRLPRSWSGQVSHGYLHEPEELEEGDTHRTTASLHYGAAGDLPLAVTVLWGRNNEEHGVSDSFLVESAFQATPRDQVFGRLEWVEKDSELLSTKMLSSGGGAGGGEGAGGQVDIVAVTGGYMRSVDLARTFVLGVGADLTAYGVPSRLGPVYDDFPLSAHLVARLRWGEPHAHSGHDAP